MKRTILFLLAATTAMSCLFAQTTKSPFSELGYKKQVMYTSSKGEFEEFNGNPDVVEIGSVYFNVYSGANGAIYSGANGAIC